MIEAGYITVWLSPCVFGNRLQRHVKLVVADVTPGPAAAVDAFAADPEFRGGRLKETRHRIRVDHREIRMLQSDHVFSRRVDKKHRSYLRNIYISLWRKKPAFIGTKMF
jgi:hypothetical protein